MKSTTPQRLATCAVGRSVRYNSALNTTQLEKAVLDAIAEATRLRARYGSDSEKGIKCPAHMRPYWTDQMREHARRMRAEGRLPVRGVYTPVRDQYGYRWQEVRHQSGGIVPPKSPPQPNQDVRTTRTSITLWPNWLPYTLLGALGFALGYTILHRYV